MQRKSQSAHYECEVEKFSAERTEIFLIKN